MPEKPDDRQLAAQIMAAFIGKANLNELIKPDGVISMEQLRDRILKMVSQK